jgi:hypothetical protein
VLKWYNLLIQHVRGCCHSSAILYGSVEIQIVIMSKNSTLGSCCLFLFLY